MKILICCVDCPYPLNAGGNQAAFQMIDFLRSLHHITLLCMYGEEGDVGTLRQKWPDVEIVVSHIHTPPVKKTDWKTRLRKLYHTLRGYKPCINSIREYQNARMPLYENNFFSFSSLYTAHLTALMDANLFDFVQVEFAELLGLVYAIPERIRKVFVHHEIRFLRLEQEKNTLDHPAVYEEVLIKSSREQELRLLSVFDAVITLDSRDKDLLASYLPGKKIYNSPFATPIPQMKLLPEAPGEEEKLVFIGGENHYPNLDAVVWFLEKMWPELLQAKPALKFYVIGNWRRETVEYFGKVPNLAFTGFVENIEPVFSGSVMIVPVRIGSGIRVKILDAIAYRIPLVTTSTGKGGLPISHGTDCIVADTEKDFVSGILQLLNDRSLQQSFTTNAWEAIHTLYTKEACGNLRNGIYEDIVSRH